MTKRDEIIEAMARAICESEGLDWDAQANHMTSGGGSDDEQQGYRDQATSAFDAALRVMSEPSEEQKRAAINALSGLGWEDFEPVDAERTWTAMLSVVMAK